MNREEKELEKLNEHELKKAEKDHKKITNQRSINKDIKKIAIGIGILFLCMAVYCVWFIEFSAPSAINSTYNKRSQDMKERVVRGKILADNGDAVLAETLVDGEGNESRSYPYGALFAHAVGFEDKGGLGLESSYNYYLLASNINIFKRLVNEYRSEKSPGNSIVTSLDTRLQSRVSELLSGAGNSAAIVLEPDTGRIRAMVSKPDFDPNTISDVWEEITSDENNSVLLNRSTQGLYAPGSTFKIFTLNEYLNEHSSDYDKYSYDCTGEFQIDNMKMHCYDFTAHGKLDLKKSLAYSCNCSFSNIGLELKLSRFRSSNRKLLFNSPLPLDIAYNESSFSLEKDATEPEIVQTSIGQGNTLVTPAHLACVISAIANDGVLAKPHLVDRVINDNGTVIKEFETETADELFSKERAAVLKDYLKDVVDSGTANIMANEAYSAYGKTGTAETVSNFNADKEASDHSWFAGWAEMDGRKVAVCVLVEDVQQSYSSAAGISKQIFDAYFY